MKEKNVKKIMIYTLLIIGLLIFVVPFIYMMSAATQNNAEIMSIPPRMAPSNHTMENVTNLQTKHFFSLAFFNTLFITVVGTIFATCFVAFSGYAFAKFNFKYRDQLFKILLFTTMIPLFSTIVPRFLMFANMGLINTYIGLILPGLAAASSVFLMRQYMYAIPDELIESARIDGANEFLIFLKVSLPMVVPGVITVALLIFIGFWNGYLWPLMATSTPDMQTVSLVIRNISLSVDELDYGMRYIALTLSVVPILLFYIGMQTKIKENNVSSASK